MNLLLFKVWISYDKRRWGASFLNLRFENDVKMYGTQTRYLQIQVENTFENDVKMYGIQTNIRGFDASDVFENDVKT